MTKASTLSSDDAPRLDGCAFALGAQRVPFLSGAMHYFRLKPNTWRAGLQALKDLGATMVETYVPWGVHEDHEGAFEFGQRDPQKDLGTFLDTAHSVGLLAFVRPGPHINGELTYFGLPARIIFDPECQARSPRGNPLPFIAPPKMFPVPSFASERFLEQADRWLAEVAKVVAPRMWPNGPVVMTQVDNEAAFYFRDGPYDQDYHPDAIAKYREFVRETYPDLEELNHAYGTEFADWDAVTPPTRFDGATYAALHRQTSFMRFHEELICSALTRMRETMSKHGLGSAITAHNLPMGDGGLPAMLGRMDRVVEVTGYDYYHVRHDLQAVRERTLRLAGTARFPCAPEMGVGSPAWFAPRTDTDSLTTASYACAYGVRGMNLYMAVDRDRWYGAPIDEDGRYRAHADGWERLFLALARTRFHDLSRRTQVAIVLPKEYVRLTRATHTLGAVSTTLMDLMGCGASAASLNDTFGFAEAIQIAWPRFVQRFARALSDAGIPYVYVESDADTSRLSGMRLVIAPSYEVAATDRWSTLCAFAADGGHVIYGPRLPTLAEDLEPNTFAEPANATFVSAYEQTDADRIVQSLIEQLELSQPFPVSPRSVETTAHYDADGARVLFVVHGHDDQVAAEIALPEPMALVDVFTDERFEGDSSITLSLSGPTCRMFVCEPRKEPTARTKAPSARRSQPPC